VFVLGVMARPGGEPSEAHPAQLAAQGLLGDGDLELVPHPLRQIDQPPAHHPVHRRDRSALDDPRQRLALRLIQLRRLPRRLAVDQPVRSLGVEPQHPVANRLQPDIPDPRRGAPRAAVVNRGHCQQSTGLTRLASPSRQRAKRCGVKILSKSNRSGHGKPHLFAMLNQIKADSGIPLVSPSQEDLV
jgi:hypothetical protein